MSMQAITYVTTLPTENPLSRLLLVMIAHHVSNETGACYAGVKRLMFETAIKSDKTVRTHLAKLEEDGLITRTKRTRDNGAKTTDEILLVGFLDWLDEIENRFQKRFVQKKKKNQSDNDPPVGNTGPPSVGDTGGSGNQATGGSGNIATGHDSFNRSINRSLSLSARSAQENEREREESEFLEKLSQTTDGKRVVENFIKPLLETMPRQRHQGLKFFERMCRKLSRFSDGALLAAADQIVDMRGTFPAINLSKDLCKRHQPDHLIVVHRDKDPAAWGAWLSHYSNIKLDFKVKAMIEGSPSYIKVTTRFPPVETEEDD